MKFGIGIGVGIGTSPGTRIGVSMVMDVENVCCLAVEEAPKSHAMCAFVGYVVVDH